MLKLSKRHEITGDIQAEDIYEWYLWKSLQYFPLTETKQYVQVVFFDLAWILIVLQQWNVAARKMINNIFESNKKDLQISSV